jgi:hypothetical protein
MVLALGLLHAASQKKPAKERITSRCIRRGYHGPMCDSTLANSGVQRVPTLDSRSLTIDISESHREPT